LKDERWIILMLCYANAIMEYNGRISGISSAPLNMEYENSIIEQSTNSHSHSSKV